MNIRILFLCIEALNHYLKLGYIFFKYSLYKKSLQVLMALIYVFNLCQFQKWLSSVIGWINISLNKVLPLLKSNSYQQEIGFHLLNRSCSNVHFTVSFINQTTSVFTFVNIFYTINYLFRKKIGSY